MSRSKSNGRSKSPKSPKSPSKIKLTAKKLAELFHDHAVELGESKEATARFRSTSYDRVASKIESINKKGTLVKSDIDKLDISDHMKKVANKLLSGGKMKKVKSKTRSKVALKTDTNVSKPLDTNKLLKELSEFMGIGTERAKVLIEAGVKNVNSLHMKKYFDLLPEETKLFIKLKPLQKIPHEHIDVLKPYIDSLEKPNLKLTLVGSYRREKPFSSDIDVMIVSSNENAVEIFYKALSDELDGKVYPYSKGKDKLSLIVDMTDLLESDTSYVYKIDAFRTLPEDATPMLIYSTGSKEFNISMRSKAKKLGYMLNQKGLFKDGKKIENLNSEEDYFTLLGMDYLEPKDRI